jgi:hypothetical protein
MVASLYPSIYGHGTAIPRGSGLSRTSPVPLSDNLLHQIITPDRSVIPACESF